MKVTNTSTGPVTITHINGQHVMAGGASVDTFEFSDAELKKMRDNTALDVEEPKKTANRKPE